MTTQPNKRLGKPYGWKISENGLNYLFETESGLPYIAYFQKDLSAFEDLFEKSNVTFGCDFYEFAFAARPDVYSPSLTGNRLNSRHDARVKATLHSILVDFTRRTNCFCFYVCLNSDNRAAARFRLFRNWLMTGLILHEFRHIEMPTSPKNGFYAGFIVRQNNPEAELLAQLFSLEHLSNQVD